MLDEREGNKGKQRNGKEPTLHSGVFRPDACKDVFYAELGRSSSIIVSQAVSMGEAEGYKAPGQTHEILTFKKVN